MQEERREGAINKPPRSGVAVIGRVPIPARPAVEPSSARPAWHVWPSLVPPWFLRLEIVFLWEFFQLISVAMVV